MSLRCLPLCLRRLAAGLVLLAAACAHQPAGVSVATLNDCDASGATALPPESVSLAVACPVAPGAETGAAAMRAALSHVAAHGLDPAPYEALADAGGVRDAWLLAATHLRHGVLDPDTLAPRTAPDLTLAPLLTGIALTGDTDAFTAALDRAAPTRSEYAALRAELSRQRALSTLLPSPEDRAAAETRIATLRINLERLRWLPSDYGERYVLANIPAFEVSAVSADGAVERHSAIFGKLSTQTPEFSDQIEYVIFNPWWEVPPSIARRDKLPQFRASPGDVTRLGYRVYDHDGNAIDPSTIDWATVPASPFPYQIRQAPGAANALGQVKIMFPNPDNVYLHDTPEKALFDKEVRAFSSGCIRVKDPLGLAEWVLNDMPDWDRTAIDAAVATGKETRVDLDTTIPVHVVYLTASPGADGEIVYSADVYERDAAVLDALNAAAIAPPSGT
ncbi:MAG: L,D-transpeptidase family protein [Hyphomonas sp.]|uniref:L,D-transpeptidase family protein n=1 Tax=Hyphomonas sp. TaxID=87 RepID=UPI0035272EB3